MVKSMYTYNRLERRHLAYAHLRKIKYQVKRKLCCRAIYCLVSDPQDFVFGGKRVCGRYAKPLILIENYRAEQLTSGNSDSFSLFFCSKILLWIVDFDLISL
jgi:hypothetical protein